MKSTIDPSRRGLKPGQDGATFSGMNQDNNRIIDMTLEGEFVAPSRQTPPPAGARIMLWTILASVIAMSAAIVALTLWLLAMILPLLLGIGAVAYLAHRFRFWRMGQTIRWRGPGGFNR